MYHRKFKLSLKLDFSDHLYRIFEINTYLLNKLLELRKQFRYERKDMKEN